MDCTTHAAASGSAECLALLTGAGAAWDLADKWGRSIAMCAHEAAHVHCLRILDAEIERKALQDTLPTEPPRPPPRARHCESNIGGRGLGLAAAKASLALCFIPATRLPSKPFAPAALAN